MLESAWHCCIEAQQVDPYSKTADCLAGWREKVFLEMVPYKFTTKAITDLFFYQSDRNVVDWSKFSIETIEWIECIDDVILADATVSKTSDQLQLFHGVQWSSTIHLCRHPHMRRSYHQRLAVIRPTGCKHFQHLILKKFLITVRTRACMNAKTYIVYRYVCMSYKYEMSVQSHELYI